MALTEAVSWIINEFQANLVSATIVSENDNPSDNS